MTRAEKIDLFMHYMNNINDVNNEVWHMITEIKDNIETRHFPALLGDRISHDEFKKRCDSEIKVFIEKLSVLKVKMERVL
jgi:hypothetical protein